MRAPQPVEGGQAGWGAEREVDAGLAGGTCRRTALAAFCLLGVLAAGCARAAPLPRAHGGVFDLSGASAALESGRGFPLRGTWLLYWGRLIPPGAFAAGALPSGGVPVRVPAEWWSAGLPATGFATLRLEVVAPPGAGALAIRMPYVCSAYRMWANGAAVAGAGVVGATRASEVPALRPAVADLPAPTGGGRIDLVVQVSNFHHRCGGLGIVPVLGGAAQVHRRDAVRVGLDAALVGALFSIAVYSLLLFVLWPAERSGLYFALFCFFALLRALVTSSMPLTWVWSGLPFAVQLRVEYVADYAAPVALALFLRALYPDEVGPWWARLQGALAAAGLASLLWPLVEASKLIPWAAAELVALTLAGAALVGLAAWRRREGSIPLLGGTVLLVLSLVHDNLVYDGVLSGIQLLPLGVLAFVLAQQGYLAQRFAGSRAQLRRSHRVLAEREEGVRRGIAERLHGPVQTKLLLAARDLDEVLRQLPPEHVRARALVEGARGKVDEVRERDIRRVSHALHPTAVDIGLVPAVRSLALQHADGVHVGVDIAPEVGAMDARMPSGIPAPVRLAVYRVVEEALVNAQTHGAARRVDVHLAMAPGRALRVRVVDDGRGLPKGPPALGPGALPPYAGLGLRGIAARVEELGGRWRLSAGPAGGGVRLEATLPLGSGRRPPAGAAGPFTPAAPPAGTPAPPGPAAGPFGPAGRSPGPERSR